MLMDAISGLLKFRRKFYETFEKDQQSNEMTGTVILTLIPIVMPMIVNHHIVLFWGSASISNALETS